MPGAVDPAADVVDVCGSSADGSSQFLLLGVIHFDDIAVDRHLAQICPHIMGAELLHLVLYEFLFLFGDAEGLDRTCCCTADNGACTERRKDNPNY